MALEAGTKLGHYEVVSSLGAGGMGEVYRAKDTKLGREVAIKLLLEEVSQDAERLARFEREARVLASLNHPNIATLHGFEKEGDTSFLVMELVEGETLADRIKRGAIPVAEAVPLFIQIAEGLEAAHEKGVIHRDLKPANVKVTDDGNVKILDFGLAKAMAPEVDASDPAMSMSPTLTLAATQRGEILGTAAYMSPEQARGLPVDRRADLWAFGVCLFESLTGRRVFQDQDASLTLAALLTKEPDWGELQPTVPSPLSRLLQRCLVKDVRLRLRDIADARLELLDAQNAPAEPAQHRTGVALHFVAAAALLSALAAGSLAWLVKPESSRREASDRRVARLTIPLPPGELVADPPAISADGLTLAYVSRDASGRVALYVRSLDEYSPTLVTDDIGSFAFPSFSPDGEWIVYVSHDRLMKARVTGGAPIPITAAAEGPPIWLEDGTIVFFEEWNGGLRRINASGGEVETLTVPDPPATYAHVHPHSLRGGQEILFTTWGLNYGAALFSTADSSWRRLTPLSTADPGAFGYAASGHLLSFGVMGEVLAGPFDPGAGVAPMPETRVLTDVYERFLTRDKWMEVSDNGTLVYAPGNIGRRRLLWIDREGNREPLLDESGAYEHVSLSPDGRQVAVRELAKIVILDLDRLARRPLRFPPSQNGGATQQLAPSWMPDGRSLLFSSNHEGEWDLYQLPPEGETTLSRIQLPGAQIAGATTSREGVMAFLSGREIHVLEPGGQPTSFLDPGSFLDQQPAFSPDGRALAYSSDRSGRTEVFVVPYPGPGETVQVSVGGGRVARWNSDGTELFYLAENGLMAVSIETGAGIEVGEPLRLFEAQMDGPFPYDVHPDGDRFLVIEQDADLVPDRLHVVLNWFEELERLVPTD